MSTRLRWRARTGSGRARLTPIERARRKFLRFFPGGFRDPTYLDWERDYKWETHERWNAVLDRPAFEGLLRDGDFATIAAEALRVEQRSRHSMIFSFEKMALRDAVRGAGGARAFAEGLFELLHGGGDTARRFDAWIDVLAGLPRRQTRVLTWPTATVFGFIALPDEHIFVKPTVVRRAAAALGYDLPYRSRPSWETYAGVLGLAERIRSDLAGWRPRDMIDLQSFIWVQGSDEYD